VSVKLHAPAALYPGKESPSTHQTDTHSEHKLSYNISMFVLKIKAAYNS